MAKTPTTKTVESLKHDDAKRKNIPTAEHQSVLQKEQESPRRVKYPRNTDLDPQLVWRGKDEQDWSDLVVHAPPLYIQEKVHPKVLIDDLLRHSSPPSPSGRAAGGEGDFEQFDLFADFNGMPKGADKTEFYAHDQNWSNRMILGDSLQVMASLSERESLRGKVQCIYFDPPYGIKFNSNFQWSTTSRDVKDGKADHITREPEQVKAFRDTWRDGIHSYLTYLRDRLTVARDLLTDSGSIFVQIGDENVHRVRAVMDEVFGDENFVSQISFVTTTSQTSKYLPPVTDIILWYSKAREGVKYRSLFAPKDFEVQAASAFALFDNDYVVGRYRTDSPSERLLVYDNLTSRSGGESSTKSFEQFGRAFLPSSGGWKTSVKGLAVLGRAGRIGSRGNGVFYVRYFNDFPVVPINNLWRDTQSGGMGKETKQYVVQTNEVVIQRCMLMTTDPGDLVLDPTCGSGTTATVAEQWGRRWITIDTSRVALALARARIMGARYPFYLLADSREGQIKEAEVTRTAPSSQPVQGNIRHGFVYERVPHITLKSIANNAEIDVIWDKWQAKLEPLREQLSTALGPITPGHTREGGYPATEKLDSRLRGNDKLLGWQEWEIPRELPKSVRPELVEGRAASAGSGQASIVRQAHNSGRTVEDIHRDWWEARIARQKEIDKSIAAKAEFEYLYDKPYDDKKKVRVAGPFTVESLSPHRMLGVDENDDLIDTLQQTRADYAVKQSFPQMILENLKTAGVQQAHKEDRITFTALSPWPGEGRVCAEGRYLEGDVEKRAGIFIGPEFGTVQRADLVEAARECGDAGFDVLIACAFNYEAHATEFSKLGRIPVLKARMNADLHMAEDLKNTGKGNLFVIFGEPDIDLLPQEGGNLRVKVNGVDVFKPQTSEVVSHGADGIACWFIDTDYNGESFFVRHAYFLGANDPYSALKTTLKAEINEAAWATLNSDTSRAFDKPKSGRIAVKVINHLGDEVMKVFRV